ncbi:MAG: CBS domain-containing protein [Anaerolineales bacterium]
MKTKLIKDYMTTKVITISSDKTLPDAYWLMVENKISRVPVVDKGKLVGLVTLEDLRRAEPPMGLNLDLVKITDRLSKITVAQVMTKQLITIHPDANLVEAARIMLEKKISALPVMQNEALVGIIADRDILKAFVDLEGSE